MALLQGGGINQSGSVSVSNSWEDELKKRMALARSQGWNEDEVNRSAMIERGVRTAQERRQQAEAQQQQQEQSQKKKTKGRGGFLTSLISEGGATGGAAAGAMAGTAILPGVGTLIGGALGGLLGGFGGSAVEQKVRDDNVDWGKAGVEGAFSAIPGGTGKVVKTLAKGGVEQGIKTASKDELADLFTKTPGAASKFTNRAGADAQAGVRGVVANAPVQGRASQRLTNKEADELNAFMNENGLKGTRSKQQQALEKLKQGAAEQIDQTVNKSPIAVGPDNLITAQNNIRSKILGENGNGVVGFNASQHGPIADQFASQMAGIKDSAGWLNFKRGLDEVINYSRTNQGVDPMVEQVAKKFRSEASAQLNKLHPDIAVPNALYAQSQKALDVMARAKDTKGVKVFPALADLGGDGIGAGAKETTKDFTSRLMQKTSGTRPITDQFMRQVAGSTAANYLVGDPGAQDPNQAGQDGMPEAPANLFDQPQNADEDLLNQMFADGSLSDFDTAAKSLDGYQAAIDSGGAAGAAGGANASGLQYSSSELFNAAMKAFQAGDTASYKQLADAADMAASLEKQQADQAAKTGTGSGNGLNVTKVTSQQYGLANSGMQSLQQLAQMIQGDPGIVTKTATPGRQLPIVGGFISNAVGTGQYDSIGYNIADSILRLRTGATANESEVKNLQSQIMPRAGDSQQTIQVKLNQIANMFKPTLQLAQQSGGSSTSDFEDQLMAMMGGGSGQQQPAYGY